MNSDGDKPRHLPPGFFVFEMSPISKPKMNGPFRRHSNAMVQLIFKFNVYSEEQKMKTITITLILAIAFLSAAAFAGNSVPTASTSGFSVVYKTSN